MVLDQVQPEQPDLVEDIPAHCMRVGLDDICRSLPKQTILQFYHL